MGGWKSHFAALGLVCVTALTGCGVVGSLTEPVLQLQYIALRSDADANASSPTAVDVVFVYEAGVIDVLQAATAADWFSRRQQFLRDFPEGLAVKSWEVVPDSVLPIWEVPEEFLENQSDDQVITAFVFADYLSPGDHRAKLESRIGTRINLGRDDFTLSAFNPDG